MQLSIHYLTHYSYAEPPRRLIQLLRLTPLSFAGQNVLDWRIDVDCDARLREGRDGYGNVIHMLYADRPTDSLRVTVVGRVLTEDRAGVVTGVPGDLPPPVFLRPTALTATSVVINDLARATGDERTDRVECLHRLAAAIHGRMRFLPGETGPSTTAADAIAAGAGVCQDFAHIFIAAARAAGVPARYISGHLFRRDGALEQTAAHAWAEAWVEHLGWVAFDPTNGISADDAYVRVAAGLDYRDAAPFAGARSGGGEERLAVNVEVRQARAQAQRQSQS